MKSTLVIALILMLSACSSLRGSEQDVREYVLTKTPIGMDLSELETVAEENKWDIDIIDIGLGLKQRNGKMHYETYKPDTILGNKTVNGHLGHYQGFPFRVDIVARWAIDENNKIIELLIQKQHDAL